MGLLARKDFSLHIIIIISLLFNGKLQINMIRVTGSQRALVVDIECWNTSIENKMLLKTRKIVI